jgi:hypothetical protein
MTNRREFIQQGVALSAAPFVLRPVVGVTAQTERLSPVLAIFDHQYVESRFFASALATRGVPTHGINGDVTALWYNDLYHRWAAGPSPIVGLTGASSLFCLEQLAWAVERRVVFRAEHRQLADDGIEHRLTGPEPHPASSRDIDSNWPLWSATVVQTLPARLRRGVKFDARAVGSAHPESAVWEEPLVTWVIAPKPVGYAPS